MKKELRKIGFVLVAATSMLAFSCGGAEEPTTETAPETPVTEVPVVIEEPVVVEVDTTGGAACEGGACDTAPAH